MKWQTTWLLIRDVLVTGTGLALIISQIFARQPSDALIVAGLALTTPSLAAHGSALLSGPSSTAGPGPQPPSSSSSPHGSPPSSPPPTGGTNG